MTNKTQEQEAREAWEAYCATGQKPADVPERPDLAYPKEWKGWADWLGWRMQ